MFYYFIVNVTSRTGKAEKIWKGLEVELQRKAVPYEAYITEYADHARGLASMICGKAAPKDCIVVVGGDGTANEAVNGIAETDSFEKIYFGFIPTGSGNDLGRGLDISSNPMEALNQILEGRKPYLMDVGYVRWNKKEGRYFAISSGVGLDALVCKMVAGSKLKMVMNQLHMGKLSYILMTLRALLMRPTTDVELLIDGTQKRTLNKLTFIAAMIQKKEGGGVPMAPKASNVDGKLSVCMAWGMSRFIAFTKLPFLATGTHAGQKGMEVFDCETFEVRLKQPLPHHTDGEYRGERKSLRFECVPSKLRVQK